MKPKVNAWLGAIILCLMLCYSCKQQAFLKQKYVHGHLGPSSQVAHIKSFIKKMMRNLLTELQERWSLKIAW